MRTSWHLQDRSRADRVEWVWASVGGVMRFRFLLPVFTLALVLSTPSLASAKLAVGVSDQQAATFYSPFYKPAKLTLARYIVPYDVTTDPVQTERLEAWLIGALTAKQKILISFEHSRKSAKSAGKLPTTEQYRKAITAFKKKYGSQIDEISAWNEVNRKFDKKRGEGQPTWNKPEMAAKYYGVAKRVFPKNKMVALDVLDQNDVKAAVSYIKKFRAAVKKQKLPAVKIWGLHPYSDVNRFSTSRTKAMIKAVGSKGEIWITEASGLVKFGKSFPYNEKRAAAANKCMFTIAKLNKRTTRLYVFGWAAGGSFDAGLIGTDGEARPGYTVVKKRQAGPCKKPKK